VKVIAHQGTRRRRVKGPGCYHRVALELLTAVGLTGVLLAGGNPSAEALAGQVEERHRGVNDLRARFVQTYRSGALGREVVERGVLSLKKPGRMLWEYEKPEKKTFVSDGTTFYFYVPADRQVIKREGADLRGIPALLLSGRGEILSQFQVQLEDAAPPLQRLRLTPKKPDPEVEQVLLEVDESHRIRAIEVIDAQGNRSQFRFEGLQENLGLKDELFRFHVPRGVEVITG
jgi:outer membrane lipoprotein carrier protein